MLPKEGFWLPTVWLQPLLAQRWATVTVANCLLRSITKRTEYWSRGELDVVPCVLSSTHPPVGSILALLREQQQGARSSLMHEQHNQLLGALRRLLCQGLTCSSPSATGTRRVGDLSYSTSPCTFGSGPGWMSEETPSKEHYNNLVWPA